MIHALECGADNFLTKPCQPENLVARVRQVLESQHSVADAQGGVEVAFLGQRYTVDAPPGPGLGLRESR